jgi:hypothetical protein
VLPSCRRVLGAGCRNSGYAYRGKSKNVRLVIIPDLDAVYLDLAKIDLRDGVGC